jgi:23S rRNA (cytidine1920-2'-O)/16S rRNA (cytidine1409-2'-O)-methyltransferase
MIEEGQVVVRGVPTPKPATLVAPGTPISLVSTERRWVSRGAHKLLAALDAFPIEVRGRRAIDVGSSTGGFTEVLLDHGAVDVVALDVGRGQLHASLRGDHRVHSHERTNFRHIEPGSLGGPFPLLVADLSFISLCTVSRKLAEATTDGADLVLLVKPQFEATRSEVGRGGVIRDPEIRRRALSRVVACLADAGINAQGVVESPIKGSDGNVEYLLWLRKDRPPAALEVPV